jgi:hypothetical protein
MEALTDALASTEIDSTINIQTASNTRLQSPFHHIPREIRGKIYRNILKTDTKLIDQGTWDTQNHLE